MSTQTLESLTFEALPALAIVAKGEVVSSNVGEFRAKVAEWLSALNREPSTDEEFGQAQLDIKGLKLAEDTIKAAREEAMQQAESLHALFAELDAGGEEIRQARLTLEKAVETQTAKVKANLVAEALALYPVDARVAERQFKPGLLLAMKGKRTIDSMRKALEIERLTKCKLLEESRAIIERFVKAHGETLVPDKAELELKTPDSVEAELRRRFEAAKAEAERKRLAEEAARAKAEADRLRAEKAESNRPPAPPVAADEPPAAPSGFSPVPDSSKAPAITEAEEWAKFEAVLLGAFGALKPARQALVHQKNISRAQVFANAVNQAWQNR